MNYDGDYDYGDRVYVEREGPGTITDSHRPRFGGIQWTVDLDNGDTWTGLSGWFEHYRDEPDDGELADRAYDLAIDHEMGV